MTLLEVVVEVAVVLAWWCYCSANRGYGDGRHHVVIAFVVVVVVFVFRIARNHRHRRRRHRHCRLRPRLRPRPCSRPPPLLPPFTSWSSSPSSVIMYGCSVFSRYCATYCLSDFGSSPLSKIERVRALAHGLTVFVLWYTYIYIFYTG